jgi:NAD(P)-dependent dehydrogenase (short-subunit alcohol dehydrogenase family)
MGLNLKPLSEQVIVVFGASTGIGRVTELEACRRGARVVAAARGEDARDSLAAGAGAPDRSPSGWPTPVMPTKSGSGESKGADDTDALDQPVAGDDRRLGVVSNLRR